MNYYGPYKKVFLYDASGFDAENVMDGSRSGRTGMAIVSANCRHARLSPVIVILFFSIFHYNSSRMLSFRVCS